jgi:hypothetical protein
LSCSMSMMQNCPCKNNVVDFSVSWSSMWFLSMRRLFPIFRMCILASSHRFKSRTAELNFPQTPGSEACLFGHCRGRHLC